MKSIVRMTCLGLLCCIAGQNARGDSHQVGAEGAWPQWRGANFDGMAPDSETPSKWSETENLSWKVAIPGKGHSTPIIWGDRIFLHSAVPSGSGQARGTLDFVVICIDRESGDTRWQKTVQRAKPHEGYHRQYGSYASASPITDGERVYSFFGSRGLYCLTMDGEPVWEKDFGGVQMRMRHSFGEGTSPALYGDTLVMHFDDNSGASFIVAVDKKTGDEIWKVKRDEISSWSTPRIIEHEGRAQVIVAATSFVRSYDLETGEVIWKCAGLGTNVIPIPQISHGNVIVMSGHRRPAMFAIELGGSGDLTGTDAVKWSIDKGMPYTPSPLMYGDDMYFINRRGLVSCVDTATGEPHYLMERLPNAYSFKASPTASKGKIYLATEQGDVVVIKPGPKLEVLAINSHDEFFVASPAIAGDELFLRGDKHLFRITSK